MSGQTAKTADAKGRSGSFSSWSESTCIQAIPLPARASCVGGPEAHESLSIS